MHIPSELRQIWRVVQVVMTNMGFTMGLYLYSYGAYFHDLLTEKGANAESSMLLIAILFMVHNGLIALLEVPMGALGDALGRKKTVVWSLICRVLFFAGMAAMYFCETLSYSYLFGVFAAIAFSINYTMFSGTFIAWIVDSSENLSPSFGYERLIGRAHVYRQVSFVIGSMLGMYLYTLGMSYVAYSVAAILCLATLIVCLGDMEESSNLEFLDDRQFSMSKVLGRIGEIVSISFRVSKRNPAILGLIILYSGFTLVVNVVDYFWPVAAKTYMSLSLHSMRWALLAAAIASAAAVTSWLFTKYTDRHSLKYGEVVGVDSLRRLIVYSALMLAMPVIGLSVGVKLGHFAGWFFVAVVLCSEAAYGFFSPVYDSLLNKYIPAEFAQERATILSFGSMIRSVLVLLMAIPSSGDSGKTTVAAWLLPTIILLVSIVGMVVLTRNQGEEAEHKSARNG